MKTIFIFISTLVLLMFNTNRVNAFEILSGDNLQVNKVIDSSLIVFGDNIDASNDVKGDLICAGRNVVVKGKVDGDVLCATQNLLIENEVGGDLRFLGQVMSLNDLVKGRVSAFGQNLRLSEVENEVLIGGMDVTLNGRIRGDVLSWSQSLLINDEINGDVNSTTEYLKMGEDGFIEGDLVYSSAEKQNLNEENVLGEISYTKLEENNQPRINGGSFEEVFGGSSEIATKAVGGVFKVMRLLTSLVSIALGLVMIALFPKFFQKMISVLEKEYKNSFVYGLAYVFITPVLLIVFVITIVGIPLSMIGGLLMILINFLSKIVVGTLIGQKVIENVFKTKNAPLFSSMIVGLMAIYLLFLIPVFGWLISIVVTIFGSGALLLSIKQK